jgi:hypothetical protein
LSLMKFFACFSLPTTVCTTKCTCDWRRYRLWCWKVKLYIRRDKWRGCLCGRGTDIACLCGTGADISCLIAITKVRFRLQRSQPLILVLGHKISVN